MQIIKVIYPMLSRLREHSRLTVSHISGIDWLKTDRNLLQYKHKDFLSNYYPSESSGLIIRPQSELLLFEWSDIARLSRLLGVGAMALCMPESGSIHQRKDIVVRHGRIFNPDDVYDILRENVAELQRLKELNVWQKIAFIWEILVSMPKTLEAPPKVRSIIKLIREKEE